MTATSLDGRRFSDVTDAPGGDVGADTIFEYHQIDDMVWARYAGGAVRLGYLVGTRAGDQLDFRYSHLSADGTTASGHCTSTVTQLPDGRLECQERWEWESRDGSGTSLIREITKG